MRKYPYNVGQDLTRRDLNKMANILQFCFKTRGLFQYIDMILLVSEFLL